MKGRRHTTEEKIRMLREVDGGRSIREVCQEKNLSEATYHRWQAQFGLMEVNEAKRLKELERENGELKKMLAESLLKNRVLEAVCKKSSEPGGAPGARAAVNHGRNLLGASRVPDSAAGPFDLPVSRTTGQQAGAGIASTAKGTVREAFALRVSADRGALAAGRLESRPAAGAAVATCGGAARAADEKEDSTAWSFDGPADAGDALGRGVEVGFHCGCDGARRIAADADHPR